MILIWENKSDKEERISIKEELNYPLGIIASIYNENRESIVKYPAHFLNSKKMTIHLPKEGEVKMKPNQIIRYKIDLLRTIVLKDGANSISKQIPKGKYFVQFTYNYKTSNEVLIEVK